jgi:hypothetical protein
VNQDLDEYRLAARLIWRGVRRLYTADAIRRGTAESGIRGSHLGGVLLAAGRELETEVFEFVANELLLHVPKKATLGVLARAVEGLALDQQRPGLSPLAEILGDINAVWTRVKHNKRNRKLPSYMEMITALRDIQKAYQLLDEIRASGLGPYCRGTVPRTADERTE